MYIKDEYSRITEALLNEHREVFEKQDLEEIRNFMDAIVQAKRIFVLGAGREGIASRAFAMRLSHLGKETHWVWDDTTPGMGKGDLLIMSSGSGKIGHIHYIAQQARNTGAKLAIVTGTPKEITPAMADVVLFVPACVYNGTDERCVPSIQPMGSLYEQHLFLLYDVIILMLEKEMKLTHDEMEARHRNVE